MEFPNNLGQTNPPTDHQTDKPGHMEVALPKLFKNHRPGAESCISVRPDSRWMSAFLSPHPRTSATLDMNILGISSQCTRCEKNHYLSVLQCHTIKRKRVFVVCIWRLPNHRNASNCTFPLTLALFYRVFIKYCISSLNCWNFSKLCQFCLQRWCSTCHLAILAWSPVYTYWHRGKQRKARVRNISKIFGKKHNN